MAKDYVQAVYDYGTRIMQQDSNAAKGLNHAKDAHAGTSDVEMLSQLISDNKKEQRDYTSSFQDGFDIAFVTGFIIRKNADKIAEMMKSGQYDGRIRNISMKWSEVSGEESPVGHGYHIDRKKNRIESYDAYEVTVGLLFDRDEPYGIRHLTTFATTANETAKRRENPEELPRLMQETPQYKKGGIVYRAYLDAMMKGLLDENTTCAVTKDQMGGTQVTLRIKDTETQASAMMTDTAQYYWGKDGEPVKGARGSAAFKKQVEAIKSHMPSSKKGKNKNRRVPDAPYTEQDRQYAGMEF